MAASSLTAPDGDGFSVFDGFIVGNVAVDGIIFVRLLADRPSRRIRHEVEAFSGSADEGAASRIEGADRSGEFLRVSAAAIGSNVEVGAFELGDRKAEEECADIIETIVIGGLCPFSVR